MNLQVYYKLFFIIPLVGFLLSLFVNSKRELIISRIAFFTAGTNLLALLGFLILWIYQGGNNYSCKEIILFEGTNSEFAIETYFDKISSIYLTVGSLLIFLITIYSRYYLHREQGYKRFFSTILFFYFGFNFTILSGSLATLFLGWEILGISSYLLISFYRDRYLPVRNALKVFSIYRIGDVGIILAIWACHHVWHENISFEQLNSKTGVHDHLVTHGSLGVFIALALLLAAAAKSAQLPFSSWLPRAMEGPTPSSAIFYGSLSVHLGVFLLLRTTPLWEEQIWMRILMALLGICTSVIATMISRVQSSIKTQIAYASIAQIGLIFVEMAFGFYNLALFHFAGNAFLRTYQLLISPSIITYLIREQLYNFKPKMVKVDSVFWRKIKYGLYIQNLREWNLDQATSKIIFKPLKRIGNALNFLTYKNVLFFILPLMIFSFILFVYVNITEANTYFFLQLKNYLPYIFSFFALLLVMRSFAERKFPRLAWILILFSHLWIALALSFKENYNLNHLILYLSGILSAGLIGYLCINYLKRMEKGLVGLDMYYGHVYEYPKLGFVFLLCSLGLMGFPITTSFIGEEMLFGHISLDQPFIALMCSVSYIMTGIALMRIYGRLFMGPHIKTYHEKSVLTE